jgi:hypothetical protein
MTEPGGLVAEDRATERASVLETATRQCRIIIQQRQIQQICVFIGSKFARFYPASAALQRS